MNHDKRPKRPGSRKPDLCKFPGCGRPTYARNLCQSHHRQALTKGELKPIRPYRKRASGTVKFAGFRLSSDCAGKIELKASRKGISKGAAIAEILESWRQRIQT